MIFIKQNKNHYVLLGLILLLSLFIISWVFYKNNTSNAADARKFNPSNIISDYVMTNKNSMSESAINDFLKNKGNCRDYNLSKVGGSISGEYITRGKLKWHIDGGHFVCLAEERFNGESAAKIIWQAAQDFNINPQVLIVLLEKEQGLISDSYPNNMQYQAATGYGCPDTTACDSNYYGFKNQVRNAARFFHAYQTGNVKWYKLVWPGDNYTGTWQPFTYNLHLHPNYACGSVTTYIENRSTASLYSYTPYRPDQQALNAQYGTGGSCSSYGNRNFWLFFTDWFGSTQIDDTIQTHPDGTLVDINGNVYLIENNSLHHIINGSVFESHDYRWNDVKRATSGDRNLPISWSIDFIKPGVLYTDGESGVYTTVKHNNEWVKQLVSYDSFISLKYKWSQVRNVPKKHLPKKTSPNLYFSKNQHTEGTLIVNSSGMVYLIDHGTLRYVSATVFESQGWKWSDINIATKDDLQLPSGANMLFKQGSLLHSNGDLFIVQHQPQGPEILRPIGPYYCLVNTLNYSLKEAINVSPINLPNKRGSIVTC